MSNRHREREMPAKFDAVDLCHSIPLSVMRGSECLHGPVLRGRHATCSLVDGR